MIEPASLRDNLASANLQDIRSLDEMLSDSDLKDDAGYLRDNFLVKNAISYQEYLNEIGLIAANAGIKDVVFKVIGLGGDGSLLAPRLWKGLLEKGNLDALFQLFAIQKINLGGLVNASLDYVADNDLGEIARALVVQFDADPSYSESRIFRWAAEAGDLELVELLLKDKRVDVNACGGEALGAAAANGHLAIVQKIVSAKKFKSDGPHSRDSAVYAARNCQKEVLSYLLKSRKTRHHVDFNKLAIAAIQGKDKETVYAIINSSLAKRTIDSVKILEASAYYSDLETFKAVFDKYIGKSGTYSGMLDQAAASGNTAVFKFLLQRAPSAPPEFFRCAFHHAVQFGHNEIAQSLVSDGRIFLVDFSTGEVADCIPRSPLQLAVYYCNDEVTRTLLEDGRDSPSSNNNLPLGLAALVGNRFATEKLLEDERVNPADCDNRAVRFAARSDNLDVLRLLLEDSRVDPSDKVNQAVKHAAYLGLEGNVDLLVKDSRVSCSRATSEDASDFLANSDFKKIIQEVTIRPGELITDDIHNKSIPKWYTSGFFPDLGFKTDGIQAMLTLSYGFQVLPNFENAPVELAAVNGHVSIVEQVRKKDHYQTMRALHSAIDKGQKNVVRHLLKFYEFDSAFLNKLLANCNKYPEIKRAANLYLLLLTEDGNKALFGDKLDIVDSYTMQIDLKSPERVALINTIQHIMDLASEVGSDFPDSLLIARDLIHRALKEQQSKKISWLNFSDSVSGKTPLIKLSHLLVDFKECVYQPYMEWSGRDLIKDPIQMVEVFQTLFNDQGFLSIMKFNRAWHQPLNDIPPDFIATTAMSHWKESIPRAQIGVNSELSFFELNSLSRLEAEAKSMQNCIRRFAKSCSRGEMLAFSLRKGTRFSESESLATVTIARNSNGQLEIHDISTKDEAISISRVGLFVNQLLEHLSQEQKFPSVEFSVPKYELFNLVSDYERVHGSRKGIPPWRMINYYETGLWTWGRGRGQREFLNFRSSLEERGRYFKAPTIEENSES